MNVDKFVQLLETSGVMPTAESLPLIESTTGAACTMAEAAAGLVQLGKLTSYQASCLLDGLPHPLLLKQYLIRDVIGAGGMGRVFLALHREMDRPVAVKLLHADAVASPEAIQRFQQEVKAAARLVHPNIVTAFDAGEADGQHYLVMEYVAGQTLSQVVKQGVVSIADAASYTLQTARGLDFAHSHGVVHRDIKPANLLRDEGGTVKILDMGVARFNDMENEEESTMGLTNDGVIMGTVDFMSPEQALNSRHADHRSDIYSLGCTLYYLLAGKPVFEGQTVVEKIIAHRGTPLPSIEEVRPDAPSGLNSILQRMMAKDPQQRYQETARLVADLEDFLGIGQKTVIASSPRPHSPTGTVILSHDELFETQNTNSGMADTSAGSAESQQQAVHAALDGFFSACGFRDKFISVDEEDELYRLGATHGIAPETVSAYITTEAEGRGWTVLSELNSQMIEMLEESSEPNGLTREAFNEVVAFARKKHMPRKEAIEHCLTLMLDEDIAASDSDDWFDALITRYGLG